MPRTTTPKYPSTQQELYSIADTIYANLENPANLAAFVDKKPDKYTPAFILALKAKKNTAFNMPDEIQRNSIHETFRIELLGLKESCCDNFHVLKGYIHDGFPKNQWKIKYDEAGMTVYDAALHYNWDNVVALNKKMKDFIDLYPTQLTNGFMPVTFKAKVLSDAVTFAQKHAEFKTSKQTSAHTAAKITADNLVYQDLQNLQHDAHIVFRNNPQALKQFMFSSVKTLISPPGSASLGIDIKEEGTNLPVANATITIQSETGIAITKTTNDKGQADFPNINPDNYKLKIQSPGKPDINLVKEVNTGVSARLKITIPA